MKNTTKLHDFGQRLWLDNITRDMLDDGTLKTYIDQYSVTGLTSNPTIFQKAMAAGTAYDADIAAAPASTDAEALFAQLALADLARAADLFRPVFDDSQGMDGWVSMEVSPLLANDAEATVAEVKQLHHQGARDNLFIKIPGTPAGVTAIEEATFAGIPVNVTLLFSDTQTLAAANAWMRGIERRLAAGLDPDVHSVLSLFVSRWDAAVHDQVEPALRNRLGIAVAQRTWRAWQQLQQSVRGRKLAEAGAPVQRMLWASTGTKDPDASDVLYVEALAAPGTINTMPENTLRAFANHGHVGAGMDTETAHADDTIARFEDAGIDLVALAERLQEEGTEKFIRSWHELMQQVDAKRGQ